MNTRARTLNLDNVWLQPGQHRPPGNPPIGNIPVMCLMEAISYIAGEAWSDRPRCVSPLLVGLGRTINDVMDPHARQRLKPLISRMIGTGDHSDTVTEDRERMYVCVRHLMRTWLPTYLYRHGHTPMERDVRELAAVVDAESATEVANKLRGMRVRAWAQGHLIGQAIDRAMLLCVQIATEAISSDVAHRNIGTMTAEAYWATHTDTNWDEAFDLFEELLQVSNG